MLGKEIKDRISSFLDLEEDWDSYGAKCIEKDTVDRALEFYGNVLEHISHLPEPRVCPVCDGSIHFNWFIPGWGQKERKFVCGLPEDPNARYEFLETTKEEGKETIRKSGSVQNTSTLLKIIKEWVGEPPSGGFK
jgi:hypothetical protein